MKFLKKGLTWLCVFLMLLFAETNGTTQTITIDKALAQSQSYLKTLTQTYHLKLNPNEKKELLKAVNRFIQTKSSNNDTSAKITIPSDKLLEIKKELKKYCQSMYPEKFKKQKAVSNLDKKRPQKIKSKPRSNKPLRQKTHQPIGHYANSRKNLDRISLVKADNIVLICLEKTINNPKARALLHKEIMKKIKRKATPHGFVSRYVTNETITKEVKIFKNLQKSLNKT